MGRQPLRPWGLVGPVGLVGKPALEGAFATWNGTHSRQAPLHEVIVAEVWQEIAGGDHLGRKGGVELEGGGISALSRAGAFGDTGAPPALVFAAVPASVGHHSARIVDGYPLDLFVVVVEIVGKNISRRPLRPSR